MMLAGMMFFISCTSDLIKPDLPTVKPGDTVSFSRNVQPIFTSNCLGSGCHGIGALPPDLSAANSYNSLNSLGDINTANPPKSKLYVYMAPGGNMSGHCTTDDAATVLTWIEQGAKNN